MEAAITQTVSRTPLEEITFDRSNVTRTDWRTYPILAFMDAPVIETILIDRPELPNLLLRWWKQVSTQQGRRDHAHCARSATVGCVRCGKRRLITASASPSPCC
jgi:hypothetical protein